MRTIKKRVLEYELPMRVEPQDEGGFCVSCKKWGDCYAEGEDLEEATKQFMLVAKGLINLYEEKGLKVPLKNLAVADDKINFRFNLPVFVHAT